ncbi:MAG TPA: hypothetical protein VHO04_13165 [Sphingopyxis sp.]|uniref:hypothetical protein n=1 Tax=Sphingopyxis sp. TaxID=1908224 RepID=UPI002E30C8FB|nr:hypothetical protein [Sphingopyxis sp.]HEX2813622.1 hypothetical protein [Sphingopyxis sp.]
MTFQPIRKRSYRGPDGVMCDQSEAVGADGIVKSGYSVSVGVMAADSVPPGVTPVRDTPTEDDQAHARYVERMSKRAPATAKAPADPAPAEGHSGYLARMTTKKGA